MTSSETEVNEVINLVEDCNEQSNPDDQDDIKERIALEYYKRDHLLKAKLNLLYKEPLNNNEVTLTVAGRNIVFSAYHLDVENNLSELVNGYEKRKFDFVHSETSDSLTPQVPKLYCWILKAAIIHQFNDKFVTSSANYVSLVEDKKCWKVIFEMCAVHHLATDKKYIILAIMTTMCDDARQDFMAKEMDCDTINIWQGLTEIKFCYALPDVDIDYDYCHKLRMQYWSERSFFYDSSLKIPIDTHLNLRGTLKNQLSCQKINSYQKLEEVIILFIKF